MSDRDKFLLEYEEMISKMNIYRFESGKFFYNDAKLIDIYDNFCKLSIDLPIEIYHLVNEYAAKIIKEFVTLDVFKDQYKDQHRKNWDAVYWGSAFGLPWYNCNSSVE
jgi:hypothetical protein